MFTLFYFTDLHQQRAVIAAVRAAIASRESHVLSLREERDTAYRRGLIDKNLEEIKCLQDFVLMVEERSRL